MTTFREIIYMTLDLLKESSDDAYYTEEHILFLATKFRAALIERKYKKTRNSSYTAPSTQNIQQLCVNLEPADLLQNDCGGNWLRSVDKLPEMITGQMASVTPVSDMLFSSVVLIAPERMPYVGYNKWLTKIIYAALSSDKHLYLTSSNNQFMLMEQVKVNAVFSDPVEAAKMACENNESGDCDYLDQTFPLEDALIPSCIELIVQEIAGPRYNPEDKANNASDELSDVGIVNMRVAAPNEREERNAARQQEE